MDGQCAQASRNTIQSDSTGTLQKIRALAGDLQLQLWLLRSFVYTQRRPWVVDSVDRQYLKEKLEGLVSLIQEIQKASGADPEEYECE
jgi:hypothetical protein